MHALTREELLQLLRAAKAENEDHWLLMVVTYWHGLRASEALSLTPGHFNSGYLTIQRLKGSKRTTQPLVSHADPLLDESMTIQRKLAEAESKSTTGAPLFTFSRFVFHRLIRRYGKRAGIPAHKLHPHVLKHSIAMHTIKEAGIENTRQYLGHKSGASTMEYLKASDEEASAAVMRAAQNRDDKSNLNDFERLSASEALRRALRIIEQGEAKGSQRRRAK